MFKSFFIWVTREHLQYALGALAILSVIEEYVFNNRFDVLYGGFALVLLGVAGANDYFNSPPPPKISV